MILVYEFLSYLSICFSGSCSDLDLSTLSSNKLVTFRWRLLQNVKEFPATVIGAFTAGYIWIKRSNCALITSHLISLSHNNQHSKVVKTKNNNKKTFSPKPQSAKPDPNYLNPKFWILHNKISMLLYKQQ